MILSHKHINDIIWKKIIERDDNGNIWHNST